MRENIYEQFVTTMRKNCINSKCGALRLREVYDDTSIMEYELCALQMKLYTLRYI